MSAREEALAILRERFPEPWILTFGEPGTRKAEHGPDWLAQVATPGASAVCVEGWGETVLSAARACIAAWDEATKGLDGMAFRQKWMSERALADRLAEALERAVDAADVCKRKHDEWQCDTGAHCVDASDCTGPALAAWRAARGKA